MKHFTVFLIISGALFTQNLPAQDTVAPTTGERVGSVRGENVADYNITQSWELGYRFASVGGNQDEYRSDVNYHDGVRLLGSSLTVNSKDGHGRWFDEIVLTTQGLGNDPYESATLRVQKNRWYRYDMLWRQNDYFNPGLTVANGAHVENTTYGWQDHELTLFPQSWFRVRAGYGRVTQNGPALTTEQEFDDHSNVYPIFRNIRQQFNEYRLGADGQAKGFRFTAQKRWEYFKEDTGDSTGQGVMFSRAAPYRGRTPGWMGNLFGERRWIAINAHFTYAGGKGDFIQNETAMGLNRFGSTQNRQIIVTGNGDRPVTTGDFNFTVFPEGRFSIINNTSVSNTRMTGNNFYEQFDNSSFSFSTLAFQSLSIRLITNATDLRYRFSKRLDVFGGFRYADRRIESVEDFATPGSPFDGVSAEQSNQTRAGIAGVNWLPVKNLRFHLEGEIGRNNNPFTPVSLRNYHAIRARAQYRAKSFSLGGGYQENYNNNSIQITAYSSRARNYSADASWNARKWVSLDATYSKLHLDTIGGIDFFASTIPNAVISQEVTGMQSIYVSNIHGANLGLRFVLSPRADLYVGYNITKDTGDGRASLVPQSSAIGQVFYNVQTFPLTYQSPLFRLSVKLTAKLRYNLGYQYYGYNEQFGLFSTYENFHASTGYT
ncbi:MAG TPA: hypothetical protein VFC21_10165, partial [Bryobacteraceae bacterium]|nr:hypothetical protein [Bryobacteraceae bacterium]